MSPIKNEFLTKLAVGNKIITVGDFSIDIETGKTTGETPKEIERHIVNIKRKALKKLKRMYPIESVRQTRRRNNNFRRRSIK